MIIKMKQKIKQAVTLIMIVSMLGGCAVQKPEHKETNPVETEYDTDTKTSDSTEQEIAVPLDLNTGKRPALIQTTVKSDTGSVTPNVEPYTVDSDLGNVENLWKFYTLQQNKEMADQLARNGFVVCGSAGSEFFEIYEYNRYDMIPNFVTVDSLMHTYHLYFAYLLKNI